MARRLELNGRRPPDDPRICHLCGGGIAEEIDPGRPADLPRRLVCRRCGTEYGTTRKGRFWDAEVRIPV